MAGSVNKCLLIGHLGRDPEIRSTQDGRKIATLSMATSETWKDKSSGERKENTSWHRVVVFNEKIADVCEKYLRKGAKIFVEGSLQTRSYTKDGQEHFMTEVVIQNFRGELTMLDERRSNGDARNSDRPSGGFGGKPGMRETAVAQRTPVNDLDDEIPF